MSATPKAIRWLALALHETDLGQRCKATGKGRQAHIDAYMVAAGRASADLKMRRGPFTDTYRSKDEVSA